MSERCKSEIMLGDEEFVSLEYVCQLEQGHEGPHKFEGDKATITWEETP